MTEPLDSLAPLAVYVVWHPEATTRLRFARAIFRECCADPDMPARRSLGIPVWFRTSVSPTTAPPPVPFGKAKRTAVFVLADDKLVAESVWRDYVSDLTNSVNSSDVVVGVALTAVSRFPPSLAAVQAICLPDCESG